MNNTEKQKLINLRRYCEDKGLWVARRTSDGVFVLMYGYCELEHASDTLAGLADSVLAAKVGKN
jgi:hypothetical protein